MRNEMTIGTLHAHNEHQAACPHCDVLLADLARLREELEQAQREYEGPMAQELAGAHAAIRALMKLIDDDVANYPDLLEHAAAIARAMGEET